MPTIETFYSEELRTLSKHLSSGNELITDAPLDNKGKGETFSPTDLMCTSLASCMLTLMGISANENNFSIVNSRVLTTKIMASNPRRVSEIILEFFIPDHIYSIEQKQMIARAALNCPVAKSVHPDIHLNVTFHFSDESISYK